MAQRYRLTCGALMLFALVWAACWPDSGVRARGSLATACFAETAQCIQGRFLDYWQANGGLAQFGYPLTSEQPELLEDGRTYTVQYFERARFEYHPENPPPYDVLLGQFGRRLLDEAGGVR